jgi:serine/threonine-protein kinase HipA
LNEKQIQGVYYRLQKWLPDAIQLINRSFLDSDKQEAYKKLIVERAAGFVS